MEFHITCDFRDDFTASDSRWTKDRFREFIRIIADLGMKGIHWIEMGDGEMGKWDLGSSTDLHGNAQAFIDEVPDPLAFLCEEAHGLGMKVYAVHKINDMASFGPGRFYPLGEAPREMPGIPQIGGSGQMAFRWLKDHPDKRVEIHPSLLEPTGDKPVEAIRIWHESEGLSLEPKVELYVSETNGSYVRYDGEMRVDMSVRTRRPPEFSPAPERRFGEEGRFSCIEVSGLEVSQPFLGVCFGEEYELINTIAALVEMVDSDGDPVAFSYGFSARSDYSRSLGSFREAGIAFDANWELPLEDYPGWIMWEHSAGRYRINLGKVPVLGLARGRNRYLSSPVELSYPEARAWLLGIAEYELNAGCDGVDIRVECHTQSMDFENYGFSTPIVEAYRERHGVDITREPFDRGTWRALRGEYFDLFLKEVSELILSRGKERWIHLTGYPIMDQRPDEPSLYQMFWNWEKWLAEGLVDVVNFKRFRSRNIPPDAQEEIDAFYGKAVGLCKRLDLPMAFTPDPIRSVVATEEFVCREFIDINRSFSDGFKVYNIYETATYIHLTEDGFVVDEEELWKKIARI